VLLEAAASATGAVNAESEGETPGPNPAEVSEAAGATSLSASELRWLHHLAVRRVERERKRIERDLHDGVQIHLIQIAIKITEAIDSLDAPLEQRRERLLETRQLARQALGAVRETCQGLYPSLLRDRGLVPALAALANKSERLSVHTDEEARALKLLPHVAEHLYFFVHEAVTNAWKHAGSSGAAPSAQVEVRIELAQGALRLSIRDDGCGFDPEQAATGHGLLTMEDRMHQLGGDFAIRSQPGQGTMVVGSLPLRPELLAVAR
jgi:signal transduction histidine kinase